MNYEKQQAKLDKQPVLRFNKTNAPIKDLATFLDKYYLKQFQTYEVDADDLQCHSGRSRSREDAYLAAKSYFPGITYKQVVKATKALYKTVLEHDYCHDVKRIVHYAQNCTYGYKEIKAALEEKGIENIEAKQPRAHKKVKS